MANAESALPPKTNQFKDLPKRTLTALIAAGIAGTALYFGGMIWVLFVSMAALLMWQEWYELTKSFALRWKLAGLPYIMLPSLSLIALRLTDVLPGELPLYTALLPIVAVIATDIGAYFAGRIVGGPKLCPRWSPNKTWAGLFGGMKAAAFVGTVFHELTLNHFPLLEIILLCAVLAAFAQAGDIFESFVKRKAGVKDSGKILPGHGGILDRVDGLMFAAPLFLLYAWIFHH